MFDQDTHDHLIRQLTAWHTLLGVILRRTRVDVQFAERVAQVMPHLMVPGSGQGIAQEPSTSRAKMLTALDSALVADLAADGEANEETAERALHILRQGVMPSSLASSSRTPSTAQTTPVIDPFDILAAEGEEALRGRLGSLEPITLRRIMRVYQLDTGRELSRSRDAKALVRAIIEQTTARLQRGSTFLHPKDE